MNIIVCIKQVVDTNDIRWTKNNTIDREGVQSVINPCDVLAIETALRLKTNDTKIIVISMGPPQAKEALKTAIAMGCDEAFLLCDKKFSGADTCATSTTLAAAIKHICPNFDLIICGQFAADGDTAQTGPSIAQKLGIEQITYVNEIAIINQIENTISAVRTADEEIEVIESPLPALICVNDCPYNPREILIDGYIKAQDTDITILSADDLSLDRELIGIKGSPTSISKAFRAQSNREKRTIQQGGNNVDLISIIEDEISAVMNQNETEKNSSLDFKRFSTENETKNKILIWGEVNLDGDLINSVFELVSKSNELAQNLENCEISVTTGKKEQEYLEKLSKYGVDELIVLRNDELTKYNTKNYSEAILDYISKEKIDIFLLSATKQGRDLAPFVASALKTGLTADCTDLDISENNQLAATRPTFGGELMATILCKTRPQMATIRAGVFNAVKQIQSVKTRLNVINYELREESKKRIIKTSQIIKNENLLENSKIVLGGGKGLKDKETFNKLRELASLLNARVGASRKAVDAGLALREEQIGQTGITISPDVYIAFGISGAIQHCVGVNAKKIIAINTNTNAPIVENSDVTIISDAKQLINDWIKRLSKN